MRKTESGFLLLEVIVALAIFAIAAVAVIKLFSGGTQLAVASDEYLKGVSLANHKFAELELTDFNIDEGSGEFENSPGYRWQVDVQPHASPLNDSEAAIQLSEIFLTVSWGEGERERTVQLTSIRTDGNTFTAPDPILAGTALGLSGNLGQQLSNAQTNFSTSENAASNASLTGTGVNTPAGPGNVPTPVGTSQPKVDPNFQFDVSGNPVGQQPNNQGLIGVTQ